MTVAILAYALAAGALAALAAWGLATVFRMAGQPERIVWAGGLVVAGALSVVPFVVKAFESTEAARQQPGVYRVAGQVEFVAEEVAGPRGLATLAPVDGATRIPLGGAIWLALSTGLLALGLAAEVRHRRRTGRLRAVRMRGLDVWLSEGEGPAVCGALAPRLILPRRIVELASRDRAVVLTHEAEHLRARDPQLNALAFLIVVAVPWNPFVWWLRRQVARAVEGDCDKRALERRGVRPGDYVDVLLKVASWNLAPPAAPLRLAMGRSARDLRERIERVLRPAPPRRTGAVAGLVLLAVGAAAPLLADPPRPPAERLTHGERGAGPGGVLTARAEWSEGADRVEAAAGEEGNAGGERPGGRATFHAAEAGGATLVLGPPPRGEATELAGGRGAFLVAWGDGGRVRSVTAEALRGSPAFERAATAWLSGARLRGADPEAGAGQANGATTMRVWVATDAHAGWSAAPVSAALYETRGLALRPDRTLGLLDVWARMGGSGFRLEGDGGSQPPTITSTGSLSGPGWTAVLRERR